MGGVVDAFSLLASLSPQLHKTCDLKIIKTQVLKLTPPIQYVIEKWAVNVFVLV